MGAVNSSKETAIAVVIILILIALLMPARRNALDHSRAYVRNNLKMLGLAVHDYHDISDSLPQATFLNEQKEPLHSWMTMLLPFAEEGPLFDQIDLSKPWNHESQAELFQQEVPLYLSPATIAAGTRGDQPGLSHFAGNAHVIRDGEPLKLKDITDGTSTTIMMGEAFGNFEPWGKPGNTRDPIDGINKLKNGFGTHYTLRRRWTSLKRVRDPGCNFTLVDGSVRWISEDIDPEVLSRLALPNDGEDVEDF